ncbi:uncharacterized protein LOC114740306 [Neltuma alba]|uniref:uncharacterized protein LOC114740306 n=1 Tax=Neltuma alba TaxID=207710 RepID=UPI0010A3128A|nr:uncharacterized protein LOC114740306 [Prosopis alba]
MPMKTCKEFDRFISKFWWGKGLEEDGIHWKAWNIMTLQKKKGGLGFRDFAHFNLAMLAKTAWRLIQNPEALWAKMLKGLYFLHSDFLNASKGGRASWGWSSILEGREFLK